MPVLPRSVPAKYTEQLRAALTAAGVEFTPALKPGTRLTYEVTHLGRRWELRYTLQAGGEPLWKVTGEGPDFEWGPGLWTDDAVAAITAPVVEPEPEPVDPHPGVPRTHLGFDIPQVIRAQWGTDVGDAWRLGVLQAVGKLPANRIRP